MGGNMEELKKRNQPMPVAPFQTKRWSSEEGRQALIEHLEYQFNRYSNVDPTDSTDRLIEAGEAVHDSLVQSEGVARDDARLTGSPTEAIHHYQNPFKAPQLAEFYENAYARAIRQMRVDNEIAEIRAQMNRAPEFRDVQTSHGATARPAIRIGPKPSR